MPNGEQHDSVWRAIDALRDQQSAQTAKQAVNERDVRELRDDINGVGQRVHEESRETREYVDKHLRQINGRIDTGVTWLKWVAGLSVPLVAGLAGALISRGGP